MTNKTLTRRNFLKLAGLSLGSLAFKPLLETNQQFTQPKLVRVSGTGSVPSVSIHRSPNEDSQILYQRFKDDLINVYEEVKSEHGPEFNPIWYKVWGGFAHRKWLVDVDHVLNPVSDSIDEGGRMGEITVPFTRAWRYSSRQGWERVYRLYYQTLHIIEDIITGPDGRPWYHIYDRAVNIRYAVPAEHMRILDDSEFAPISPDVPEGEKRVEISIHMQHLTAFEGNDIVFKTEVSTGVLTPQKKTPTGEFRMDPKFPNRHMGNGKVTDDIYAYELVGVPWCSFFEWAGGIAAHGTFWHNNYGYPMSLGCINMRNHEAKWLYRWTTPHGGPRDWVVNGYGTRVIVK